jgi:hypothetical protein
MNGLQAVQDLALYLNKKMSIKVFKFEKTVGFSGEYIVVNHLPFIYNKGVNDSNVLNVNLHVPALTSGNANVIRLTEIYSKLCELIPFDYSEEEEMGKLINGSYYSIISTSQPMEDVDSTYFLNVKIKLITNQIKL